MANGNGFHLAQVIMKKQYAKRRDQDMNIRVSHCLHAESGGYRSKKNMSTRYQKDCMVFSRQFVVWKGDIPAKSVTNQLLVEFDNWMRYEKIML